MADARTRPVASLITSLEYTYATTAGTRDEPVMGRARGRVPGSGRIGLRPRRGTIVVMAYWRFDPSRLRAARTEKGWSLAELARSAGLRPPTLSAIEMHQQPCRERSAQAIAAALAVPLEDLAAPYTAADRPKPHQLPVETFPTADDFERLEQECHELATITFRVSERMDGQYENDAVVMADVAALVRAFADAQQRGETVDLVGFEALLEYHGDRPHYAVSTLTPERRSLLVRALESFNIDAGKLSYLPGVRAAAIAVADWIRD